MCIRLAAEASERLSKPYQTDRIALPGWPQEEGTENSGEHSASKRMTFKSVGPPRLVTSRVLCHKGKGSNSLLFVFIGEHRIEDPLHAGSV